MKKTTKMKIQKNLLRAFMISSILMLITALIFSTDYFTLFQDGNAKTILFYRGNKSEAGRITTSNDMILSFAIYAIVAWVLSKVFLFDKFRLGVYTLGAAVVTLLGLFAYAIVGFLNILTLKKDYLALNVGEIETYLSSIDSDPNKIIEYLVESTWSMNLALFSYVIFMVITVALLATFVMNFFDDRKEVI